MPMRATTVRFGDALWELVEQEARREGVSSAQFVRDAAVLRVAYAMGRRGDPGFEDALQRTGAPPTGTTRRRDLLDAAEAVRQPARLKALERTRLLDTPREPNFDRLTGLAARVLDAPVALVSLVDRDRQFFKSCLGLPEPWASKRETPLSHSFCQHAVARREPLIVTDAREDEVLRTNLAIRDLNVVAYAGIPLIDDDGQALGSLCVIDSRPRHWTPDQVRLLQDLAASVLTEIKLAAAAAD